MSSIRYALENLNNAIGKLDESIDNAPLAVTQNTSESDTVIDVDFVAKRLDKAIEAVEGILSEGE